jgi:gamma-glutamylcyclotransferase (GGCT)/AIG2-like uncharacterized protein YtfP
MEKQWLFSYGTLQDPDIQIALFGSICVKKNAKLTGWSLYASHEDGYLFIKPDPSGTVDGCILEIDTNAIHTADRWEEVPYYIREKVLITLGDNTKQEVWVYTRRSAKGKPYAGKQMSIVNRQVVLNEVASLKKQKGIVTFS